MTWWYPFLLAGLVATTMLVGICLGAWIQRIAINGREHKAAKDLKRLSTGLKDLRGMVKTLEIQDPFEEPVEDEDTLIQGRRIL